MPRFERYIGIDYSGAGTPEAPLTGLRVYLATRIRRAREILPPPGGGRYWNRRALAHWLEAYLTHAPLTAVGMDLAFSFPRQYFEAHGLALNWDGFLQDFAAHWPTAAPGVRVDDVRTGRVGEGARRCGSARWRRLTDRRAVTAKSVFHFDVPGSVAKSTHAGLPWLLHLRTHLGRRVHFWPFDGWRVAPGCSLIAEVYPALCKHHYGSEGLTPDQHDAYSVAMWLRRMDRQGTLGESLLPAFSADDRAQARFEGWILGVL